MRPTMPIMPGSPHLLGSRLGEMHMILARRSSDPAFDPVTATAADAQAFADRVRDQLADAYRAIDATPQMDRRGRAGSRDDA